MIIHHTARQSADSGLAGPGGRVGFFTHSISRDARVWAYVDAPVLARQSQVRVGDGEMRRQGLAGESRSERCRALRRDAAIHAATRGSTAAEVRRAKGWR